MEDWKRIEKRDLLKIIILRGRYEFDIIGEMGMLRDRKLKEIIVKVRKGYSCFYKKRDK